MSMASRDENGSDILIVIKTKESELSGLPDRFGNVPQLDWIKQYRITQRLLEVTSGAIVELCLRMTKKYDEQKSAANLVTIIQEECTDFAEQEWSVSTKTSENVDLLKEKIKELNTKEHKQHFMFFEDILAMVILVDDLFDKSGELKEELWDMMYCPDNSPGTQPPLGFSPIPSNIHPHQERLAGILKNRFAAMMSCDTGTQDVFKSFREFEFRILTSESRLNEYEQQLHIHLDLSSVDDVSSDLNVICCDTKMKIETTVNNIKDTALKTPKHSF